VTTTRRTACAILAGSALSIALTACMAAEASDSTSSTAEASGDTTTFVLCPDLAAGDRSAGSQAELTGRVADVLLERARELPWVDKAQLGAPGAAVELIVEPRLSDDELAETELALTQRGVLGVWIVAGNGDGLDVRAERDRLEAWSTAHPEAPLAAFNDVARDAGGPPRASRTDQPGLRWAVAEPRAEDDTRTELERALPLLVPTREAWRFDSAALAHVYLSTDPRGFPAVGFEVRGDRKDDFGDLTGAHVDRNMAIVVDDVALSVANINQRLPGGGIIMGRFTKRQVDLMIAQLRAGELPAPVELVETR